MTINDIFSRKLRQNTVGFLCRFPVSQHRQTQKGESQNTKRHKLVNQIAKV